MGIFDFRSRRDLRRLGVRFPALAEYHRLARQVRRHLHPHHEEYVSAVSSALAAASLETCTFMWILCDILQPRRIADLGSGFSSFLFRAWAAQSGLAPTPEVWSADDSPEWLARTVEYLRSQGFDADRVLSWQAFSAEDRGAFDLVFHDLGSMTTRVETFPKVMSLAADGGAVVLDDVHKKRKYRDFLSAALAEMNQDYYDLKRLLRDPFGRYPWLVIR